MNSLTRAIAGKLRSSTRKCLLFHPPPPQQQQQLLQSQHLIPLLQNHSSLYSTTTRRTSTITPNPSRFKRNPKPQQQQQQQQHSSPLSSTQVPNIEIEKGLNQEEQVSKITDWARPSEIPWQAKVANSVNLIGHVQIPVQFEASPDGKYWAGTIISQRDGDSSDSPPFWIPIIFEGDLAHIAACHLKEKDFVYIDGQLSADPPPFTMSQGQANVQVMVRSINFVQWSSQKKIAFAPHKLEKLDNNGTASMKDEVSVNQLWKDLFAKPHEWWDIRLKKGNSMAAAFENKDNGQLLWINESTPEWIQKKLDCLTFDPKIAPKSHKSVSDIKDDGDPVSNSWRDLVRNPKNWKDHRKNKLNNLLKPKHPDFKHKDSGVPLWLNTAPKWVLSGLDGLEFDVPLLNVKQAKGSKGDDSWKNLVENPDKWWDNRTDKIKERAPDFKHKDTGEALWLNNCPAWLLSRLPPLKSKHTATIGLMSKQLS
ncbi:hypothetical protein HYC85_003803 [Camellia sinensis]|uniref:Uncharacterized protein n=1 Tax=Camellia sinensis TaxID=4442 RepID=A0A7J7HXC5_CAMSI|nr:hypothetical protein HYC85_003803 [Camellia sinensis]